MLNGKRPEQDRKRLEQLRSTLCDAEIEALAKRAKADSKSLTLDEVGILFLVTKDRVRATERNIRGKK